MSGGEVAAVIAAVALVVAVVALLFALASLVRTLRSLRTAVDEFRREALPIMGELRSTVGTANAELVRVDSLLTSAESVSATVDSASRLAYLAFSNPLIKVLAFATGTGRAARRLRRRA
ncbi:MAG TPA: DUF948 domain-containing protein [Acidimicrobiales bacterium]|nr:DUF948 domain-containing protein [Acidimicrobiales bacterium]